MGSGSGRRRSEAVACGRLDENALAAECGETAVEGGVADPAEGTKLCDGEGSGGVGDSGSDAVIERPGGGGGGIGAVGDGQGKRISIGSQGERDRVRRWSAAMLDGESEMIAATAQKEIGIAPSVELGGAAESLAVTEAAGALLGVVDDDDGELMVALEMTEEGEQGSDLGGRILILCDHHGYVTKAAVIGATDVT